MKHGKKPTRAQADRIRLYRLNPENWLVVKDCPECFTLLNRITGNLRTLMIRTRIEH